MKPIEPIPPLNPSNLPADFAIAFMTERPDVLNHIYRPNGLTEKETAQIAKAFGVLIDTNVILKCRLTMMMQIINHVYAMDLGLGNEIKRLRDLADYSLKDGGVCQGK